MKTYEEKIKEGRDFISYINGDDNFPSDQQLKKPQPPLVKGKMSDKQIKLPMNFENLELNNNMLQVIYNRVSRRVYSGKTMKLLELSFLLWATQGIKSIRGNNYCTLRTVPSGGARHGFETYLAIQNVEGLEDGAYHYLPMTNEIEFLHTIENYEETVTESIHGQKWGAKANAVFYWALTPYRNEWRYGTHAHRTVLMDVGHVGQSLYSACESVGLGTCGIASFVSETCTKMFDLDFEKEFMLYVSPVGTINEEDKAKEDDIYAFVKNEPGTQEV
ncbi:MAG: SagB/ThcOx family dehydrogenase [Clostridia bacterium]